MEKKTALDLACEFIKDELCDGNIKSCPSPKAGRVFCGYACASKGCCENMKQHFQQQADIPDGCVNARIEVE